MKTAIGYLKHDLFKLRVFHVKKISSAPLKLRCTAPPVSQEGEERID